ncbi:thiosulfate/3-mercaptopyruvate sulfurtransferase [Kwoniella heveanensis BCC8398]|uniref:Thiosulfate/3-mercaptopyruvate sulfurtransferase n=1 Tax=Kwoniella heveanensis BCC8398 TaxID=1296120 RepID=A0A1B9H1Y0_9TREE|nr:thiosulfate/3-mercaptopyruvate sulfurtransferase [Kwoniella heveanensis BCC8398]
MRFPAPAISPLYTARRGLSTSVARRVPLLISPKEYKELPRATTLPLDVSWHMPNSPRSAIAEYLSGPRMPGAKRFDLDEVADLALESNPHGLGHMLPTKEVFIEAARKLGIQDDTHVVLYDTIGIFSSPRAAYTFKTFGHDKVSVLNGGLPRWIAEGGEVETGEVQQSGAIESEYKGGQGPKRDWVRSYEQIVENSEKNPSDTSFEVVLDHRPLARFTGEAPEPRPGLSSGHIPNSSPLPFLSYLNPADDKKPYTSFKSLDELKKVLVDGVGGEDKFRELLQKDQGVVFTCGSGMTAAIGWLANELLREKEGKAFKTALYDESWTGYALRQESKIVKGNA